MVKGKRERKIRTNTDQHKTPAYKNSDVLYRTNGTSGSTRVVGEIDKEIRIKPCADVGLKINRKRFLHSLRYEKPDAHSGSDA